MQRLRALSIKTKLILLILLLLLPYLFFNLFSYLKLEKQIEQNAMHYSEQLVQQLNSHLDTYFDDLERSSLPIIVHPLVQEFMEISPEDSYRYFHISKRIREEVIPTIVFDRPEIYGFMIVSDQGAVVGNFRGVQTGASGIHNWKEVPNDRYKVMKIHDLASQPIVTIARKFWSIPSYGHTGFLVFDLRIRHLTQPFTEVEFGQSGFIWVLDENEQVLFHTQKDEVGQPVDPENLEEMNGKDTGSFINVGTNGEKRVVSFYRSDATGLTVLAEMPFDDLTAELDNVRNLNTWIHLTLIAAIILGVSAFSFSLTRSVSHLQMLMGQAEQGDLHVKAPENRHDEIGRLNKSFNHMVRQIRRLFEVIHKAELRDKERVIQQREASLLAMQSQINPHFLYNTLENMNAYAIVHEVMPISRMATALGEMFRYSMNEQMQVTLQDEMDHVRWFLEIQRERHTELDVHLAFDRDDLTEVKAIRLIVQPIVENAFKHGYGKHRKKPDYIGIVGESCPDGYKVTISDCGVGMDPRQKERYDQLFQSNFDVQSQWDEAAIRRRVDGIGLWNVHKRIRLTFGEPYGLSIIRSGPDGTEIELKLPYVQPNSHSEG